MEEFKIKVGFEVCPNKAFAHVFTNKVITKKFYGSIFYWSEERKENPLFDALLSIDGVVEIFPSKHQISIEKGKVFEWSDLKKEILAVMKDKDNWVVRDFKVVKP